MTESFISDYVVDLEEGVSTRGGDDGDFVPLELRFKLHSEDESPIAVNLGPIVSRNVRGIGGGSFQVLFLLSFFLSFFLRSLFNSFFVRYLILSFPSSFSSLHICSFLSLRFFAFSLYSINYCINIFIATCSVSFSTNIAISPFNWTCISRVFSFLFFLYFSLLFIFTCQSIFLSLCFSFQSIIFVISEV